MLTTIGIQNKSKVMNWVLQSAKLLTTLVQHE